MKHHHILISVMLFIISGLVSAEDNKEWPLFGGDRLHQRHSLSVHITPSNVQQLDLAWEYDTGISASFQATPIVQQGVMYVSLPFNDVVALDASSGNEIWRYYHDRNTDYKLCCGPANRGVAVADKKVFMGTVDGRLVALNARTGERLWDVTVVTDSGKRESPIGAAEGKVVSGASGAGLNMAPMVYQDMVIIGVSGVGYGLHYGGAESSGGVAEAVGIAGNYGRSGFLAAYEVDTGKQVWKFDVVPESGWEGDFTKITPDGVVLPRDLASEREALSRFPQASKFGGGSAWSTPAIDWDAGILYFGTGNPSPQMEDSSRPGDNLHTVSLVALDAASGKRIWHYQQVPHDRWGYDVASPPVLFTALVDEKQIPAVGQAGKTGWFYVHNRLTGELLFKSEAFVPQHNMFSLPTEAGTQIYPGALGGCSWSPVSLDEKRRRVFVAGIHWPVRYTLHNKANPGQNASLQYITLTPVEREKSYGILSAIDIDNGKIIWQRRTPHPLVGGVLSTATGLVFSGEGSGEFFALDAVTGKKLWQTKGSAGINAPPVSYQLGDKQYIAVAAGGNAIFGFASGRTIKAWTLP
ncbi:outer membrane protein assembly factor BamB family protein [Porticoccus sp.]